jgi:hypothetical protein
MPKYNLQNKILLIMAAISLGLSVLLTRVRIAPSDTQSGGVLARLTFS